MEELELIKREVQQYVSLKTEIDQLTDRRDTIKKRLMAHVEANGAPNEKGSLVLDVNDDVTSTKAVIKQRRVSKVFDEKTATGILTNMDLYDKCTKTVVAIDEDAVMSSYYNGELSDEDIDSMFPEKIIWALVLEKAD
jgi:hypothetical protein